MTEQLPDDVIALVIAARNVCYELDTATPEYSALDQALERFASRVGWDDDGGSIPDAHVAACSCGGRADG
ncbi:hypothetical protein ACMT1E_04475 [Sphingomonas flavalba]|uniref:hypothetical protein n=1 Tax=Sphingomonas flavalba TaxID=2559804 RepID=UPI0039E1FDC7